MPWLAKNTWMQCAVCAGALSWCSAQAPAPVSVASSEKQQVSDVSKLVDKTAGLQFGLVYPKCTHSRVKNHSRNFLITPCTSCIICYYATQIVEIFHILQLVFWPVIMCTVDGCLEILTTLVFFLSLSLSHIHLHLIASSAFNWSISRAL